MACDNTVRVLKGSVLTFESEVQICNSITDLARLQFRDILQGGLKVTNAEVNLTINNTSSTATATISETNNPEDTITVEIPAANLGNDYPVTVKVKFQATVNDLDALLENADDPTNTGKLTNTGTFTALNNTDACIGKPATVTLADTNVEEYSPKVSGYSITVCPSENDAKFEAKLCLNTICGEYKNGQYVLTITAPDGITFYQTDQNKIKAYTGCCCTSNPIIINTTQPVPLVDNTKIAIITIKDTEIRKSQKNDINDSFNNISIYVPCKFENSTTTCTKDYLIITGSIEFQDTTNPNIPITLVKLKNFALYINIDHGNVIGIGKTILC